jgi:hypothetical protein
MTLFDEQKTEEQEPQDQGAGKYLGVIIFVITLPVLIFFTHIGKSDLGIDIGICIAMNIFAILICSDLIGCWWFWVTDILVLAVHVPLVLMIQWPNVWISKFTLLPIGIADLLITVGIVRFVQKFIVRYVPPDEEE